jgi:cation:H+ antiporter
MSLPFSMVFLGLIILVISSRVLVWGSAGSALEFDISNLSIGLTFVLIVTSLLEFPSSIVATRKGAQDFALGNLMAHIYYACH